MPEPEPEVSVEQGTDWAQMGLYGAIVVGNLLVVLLGFFAYKMIKGSNTQSEILEGDDDVEVDQDEEIGDKEDTKPEVTVATESGSESGVKESDNFDIEIEDDDTEVEVEVEAEKENLDSQLPGEEEDVKEVDVDLPADAIDIDPGSEDDK
ncbi:MAG: hypothetical protein GY712_07645 [Oceanicoccus sp.]|nr:hypothetical protein [Oceanicoccus sp.]